MPLDHTPVVRYLIVCEDFFTDPANPRKASLVNLVSAIRSTQQPEYPILFEELCVFVQLTECRGPANVGIGIVHAESGREAFPVRHWPAALPVNPLEIVGLPFRVHNVQFNESGLYWVQFWYNEINLAEQALELR